MDGYFQSDQEVQAAEEALGNDEVITPDVIETGSFPAPFRSKIGNSTIDLSIPENEDLMKEEYNNWWHFDRNEVS